MIITNNLLIFTKWCTPVAIFGAFLIAIFGAYSITDYKVMNVTIFCTHPTQTSDVIVNPKNPVNPDSKFQFQENGPQNITSAAQLISNNGQKKKNPVNPDSKPFYSITKVATAPASSAIGK